MCIRATFHFARGVIGESGRLVPSLQRAKTPRRQDLQGGVRILFSNHSRWGFFNQFGEFSSLAKFVGGYQEVASPFGSAARYVRTYRIHSL